MGDEFRPGFYLTDEDAVCYVDANGQEYLQNPQMDPHYAYANGIQYVTDSDGVYYYLMQQSTAAAEAPPLPEPQPPVNTPAAEAAPPPELKPGFYPTDDGGVCYINELGQTYVTDPQMDPAWAYHNGIQYVQCSEGIYYYLVSSSSSSTQQEPPAPAPVPAPAPPPPAEPEPAPSPPEPAPEATPAQPFLPTDDIPSTQGAGEDFMESYIKKSSSQTDLTAQASDGAATAEDFMAAYIEKSSSHTDLANLYDDSSSSEEEDSSESSFGAEDNIPNDHQVAVEDVDDVDDIVQDIPAPLPEQPNMIDIDDVDDIADIDGVDDIPVETPPPPSNVAPSMVDIDDVDDIDDLPAAPPPTINAQPSGSMADIDDVDDIDDLLPSAAPPEPVPVPAPEQQPKSDEGGINPENGREYTAAQAKVVNDILEGRQGGNWAHYRILGVEKEATEAEIKKAYRKLALKLHPDKNGAPQADQAMQAIALAHATLTDEEKRKVYDEDEQEDPDAGGFTAEDFMAKYAQDTDMDDDLMGLYEDSSNSSEDDSFFNSDDEEEGGCGEEAGGYEEEAPAGNYAQPETVPESVYNSVPPATEPEPQVVFAPPPPPTFVQPETQPEAEFMPPPYESQPPMEASQATSAPSPGSPCQAAPDPAKQQTAAAQDSAPAASHFSPQPATSEAPPEEKPSKERKSRKGDRGEKKTKRKDKNKQSEESRSCGEGEDHEGKEARKQRKKKKKEKPGSNGEAEDAKRKSKKKAQRQTSLSPDSSFAEASQKDSQKRTKKQKPTAFEADAVEREEKKKHRRKKDKPTEAPQSTSEAVDEGRKSKTKKRPKSKSFEEGAQEASEKRDEEEVKTEHMKRPSRKPKGASRSPAPRRRPTTPPSESQPEPEASAGREEKSMRKSPTRPSRSRTPTKRPVENEQSADNPQMPKHSGRRSRGRHRLSKGKDMQNILNNDAGEDDAKYPPYLGHMFNKQEEEESHASCSNKDAGAGGIEDGALNESKRRRTRERPTMNRSGGRRNVRNADRLNKRNLMRQKIAAAVDHGRGNPLLESDDEDGNESGAQSETDCEQDYSNHPTEDSPSFDHEFSSPKKQESPQVKKSKFGLVGAAGLGAAARLVTGASFLVGKKASQ